MTRAEEKIYFSTDTTYKLKFIAELEIETNTESAIKCPLSKMQILLKIQGRQIYEIGRFMVVPIFCISLNVRSFRCVQLQHILTPLFH